MIAASCKWILSKIFVQLSFSDSQLAWALITTVMKDSQEGQPKRANLCTKRNRWVSAATFGLGSWSAAFTHCEVYRASLWLYTSSKAQLIERVEGGRDFATCWCVMTFLLSPKMPQVRTMLAWLCSDLACVCNSQSSWVVVEEMALLCATTPWHALLCKYDNVLKAIKHFTCYKPSFSYNYAIHGLSEMVWYIAAKGLAT